MKTIRSASWLTAVLLCAAAPAAHAQFAVIDVASLTQLVSEVQTLEQQLATARAQLSQAQAQFQAMTGDRGMEQLLAGISRNYLPADWSALQSAAQGAGPFAPLAAAVRGALGSRVGALRRAARRPAGRGAAQLLTQRQAAALLQGLTQAALE